MLGSLIAALVLVVSIVAAESPPNIDRLTAQGMRLTDDYHLPELRPTGAAIRIGR